jgi:hypothetical protein
MCTEGMVHGDSQLRPGKLLETLKTWDCSAGSFGPLCPAQWEMRQNVPLGVRISQRRRESERS